MPSRAMCPDLQEMQWQLNRTLRMSRVIACSDFLFLLTFWQSKKIEKQQKDDLLQASRTELIRMVRGLTQNQAASEM